MERYSANPIPKLAHIDILRAVAIILVVICHVSQSQKELGKYVMLAFDFGKIGVQLFFVLSAYTLCLSMKSRNDTHPIGDFYIRRYFRIAPLYYIGIIIYLVYNRYLFYNQITIGDTYQSYTTFNILCNILFIHGLVPSANNTIVAGGWSIGTEMLFYLFFPLFFMIYDKISNKKITLLFPLIALIIGNLFFYFSHFMLNKDITSPFYYYHILTQLPAFLIGMCYFFLEDEISKRCPNRIQTAILILVLLLVSFIFIDTRIMKFNRSAGVFSVAMAFCLLFTLIKKERLNMPLLQKIGQVSFSVYIVHFLFSGLPTIVLVKALSPYINSYLLFFISILITLFFAVMIAIISEKYIEKPGIKIGRRLIEVYNKKYKKSSI